METPVGLLSSEYVSDMSGHPASDGWDAHAERASTTHIPSRTRAIDSSRDVQVISRYASN